MNKVRQAGRGAFDVGSSDPGVRGAGLGIVVGIALAISGGAALADEAKGKLTFQSRTGPIVVNVQHAYLVKGPDAVDGTKIRRLILSASDVGPRIRACGAMSCSDGDLREGMTVDFDAGPRLNYWFVANDQRVQHSGTARPATMKLSSDLPQRLAGNWTFDDRGAGGPLIEVEFDAKLLKEFSKAR